MNLENSDLSSPPLPSESNIDAAVRTVGHRTLSYFAQHRREDGCGAGRGDRRREGTLHDASGLLDE
jgi:hypothetical protein